MALTNQSTQMDIKLSGKLKLDDIVRALREEVTKSAELSAQSQSEYERRARTLVAGWDMAKAGQRERYLMRAAGIWEMRRQIRAKLNEADRVIKRGAGSPDQLQAERGKILSQAVLIAEKLDKFRELPWAEGDKKAKQEANHKKKAATDEQVKEFFAAVGESPFRQAFLVAEFTGCRGEELGHGVRIKIDKHKGVPTLHFFITSAKADGKTKGIDVRELLVPFPTNARDEVKRRWLELANTVGKKTVVRVGATESQTAGQRFTQNVRHFARKAGLKISAYSFRHRVSAQLKANGNGAVNTAICLGHQTTETQRHYSRRHGSGDISPSDITGAMDPDATIIIRGGSMRTGPAPPAMENTLPPSQVPQVQPARRLRL